MKKPNRLTSQQVAEIRASDNTNTVNQLSIEYNVSEATINNALSHRTHRTPDSPAPLDRRDRRVGRKRIIGDSELVNKIDLENYEVEERTFLTAVFSRSVETALGADGDCWLYAPEVNGSRGYPFVKYKGKQFGAHRGVYEAFYGLTLERDHIVDHVCGHKGSKGGKLHRRCVNPNHLRVTSHAENVRAGEGTKVNPKIVREMRRLRGIGWTYQAIGDKFGLTKVQSRNICLRIAWADVY